MADRSLRLEDWSPDGRSLLFSEYTSRGDTDVWIYSDGKARPILSSPSNEENARFSSDGRYIAFEADDGGVTHVYVQPFPGPGRRTAISAEEGGSPVWIQRRAAPVSERRSNDGRRRPDPPGPARWSSAAAQRSTRYSGSRSCLHLMDVSFSCSLQGRWKGRSSCASSSTGSRNSSGSPPIRRALDTALGLG